MTKDSQVKEFEDQGILYPRRTKVLRYLNEFAEEIIRTMERNWKAIQLKEEENSALTLKLNAVREAIEVAIKDMPYDKAAGE